MNATDYLKRECITVGKYARHADPSIVERLRADGYSTTNQNIGIHVLESDPEMFDHILDFLSEEEN
jgi:hypothetical protein